MFDQCIYFNTTALARTLEREWAAAYRAFGLTPPQGFMLRAVLLRPGLLQSELAEALSISRSTATRTLDGLEKLALIERRPTPHDGRQLAIHPSNAARDIGPSLNEASAALTRQIKHTLGEEVFAKLVTDAKQAKSQLD